MSAVTAAPRPLPSLERALAAAVLFYGAVVFCLPVPHNEEVAALYPWWAKRLGIGNIQLHELLFIAWAGIFGWRFLLNTTFKRGMPGRQAGLAIMYLALWCGIMSLGAPLIGLDIGRTFRLFLNAGILFAVVKWSRQDEHMPLAMLVLGFLVGTIINLVISVRYPLIVYQTLRLSGQNTPGVAMAIALHLAAWLFLRTKSHRWQMIAVFGSALFAFGCAISYSRIGWFAGGLGLAAWSYVLLVARPRERSQSRRLKRVRLVLIPLLLLVIPYGVTSPIGQEGIRWLSILAEQKAQVRGRSDSTRVAYLLGTAEIVLAHPLGVGYSGFYAAMRATSTYRSGDAAPEVSVVDANPHATFLWYTTAGGIPGAVLSLFLFVALLNTLRWGLVSTMQRTGLVLFCLVAPPFLLMGMTVPYLFNSTILIVPAAIGAGWGWRQRALAREQARATEAAGVIAAPAPLPASR